MVSPGRTRDHGIFTSQLIIRLRDIDDGILQHAGLAPPSSGVGRLHHQAVRCKLAKAIGFLRR
jgi:hypothetical protein